MELKDYIKKYYMKKGDFTLSSDKKSKIYFDIKGLMLDPTGASMVHFDLVKMIVQDLEGLPFTVVGMELGGAQIVQFMVARGWHGIIIRKQIKEHGLKSKYVLPKEIPKHNNVVILDDVITTGNTVEEIKEVLRAPFNILGTYCIIDRTEKQEYKSLFKESDFYE